MLNAMAMQWHTGHECAIEKMMMIMMMMISIGISRAERTLRDLYATIEYRPYHMCCVSTVPMDARNVP